MSETKHTPGPWTAIEWSCHAPTTVVSDGRGQRIVVAECSGTGRQASESIADARLIAAAPDLLAACELVTRPEFRESFLDVIGKSTIADIKAAIRKAKGL